MLLKPPNGKQEWVLVIGSENRVDSICFLLSKLWRLKDSSFLKIYMGEVRDGQYSLTEFL